MSFFTVYVLLVTLLASVPLLTVVVVGCLTDYVLLVKPGRLGVHFSQLVTLKVGISKELA